MLTKEPATANAAFANLGARLSLQDDHNNTQAESVEDTFNWLQASKFIDGNFNVFDGASTPNCNQSESVPPFLSVFIIPSRCYAYPAFP